MLYDVTEHPLLSAEAEALTPDVLEAQALVAERVLGLRGTLYTAQDAADAAMAVALQVSVQVAQDPEAYLASSVTRGSRSISYRGGVILHPLAESMVLDLAAALAGTTTAPSGYSVLTSYR